MVLDTAVTPKYAEFFCGGGMVRAALNGAWDCVLANDIDPMKCSVYAQNWGAEGLVEADIAALDPAVLRQQIDLYWGSSPCQDFSLAGHGRGLRGAKGSVFSVWVDQIAGAINAGFAPRIIAFENVVGLISRNHGADFAAVVRALAKLGYRVGALEINAARFLPQSRPRLFVVCLRDDVDITPLASKRPEGEFHSAKLQRFVAGASRDIRRSWVWWRHDPVALRNLSLPQVMDDMPDTKWFTKAEIKKLFSIMSPNSLAKVEKARESGKPEIGMLYKRGRPSADGTTRQRAEVRFDGLAGCLRTPGGGSSRQTVVFVEGPLVRARLLSSTEVARLMGLEDSFIMPPRYNDAYKVAGDGVVVPAVQYLDQQLFQPALQLALAKEPA